MKRRPPSGFPPVHPSIEMLMSCRRFIVGTLVLCGIARSDLEDMVQIVMIAAWRAIDADRYCPDPAAEPMRVLRSWLTGICFRQATHWHDRAHRRREILTVDPWALAAEPFTDPDDAARGAETFVALWSLPLWARTVLLLAAAGHGPSEIAGILRISFSCASVRLRKARVRLARVLARGGR